jgi:hypothetical protein
MTIPFSPPISALRPLKVKCNHEALATISTVQVYFLNISLIFVILSFASQSSKSFLFKWFTPKYFYTFLVSCICAPFPLHCSCLHCPNNTMPSVLITEFIILLNPKLSTSVFPHKSSNFLEYFVLICFKLLHFLQNNKTVNVLEEFPLNPNSTL